jgi:BirA family biotin operon repressor/biotin-[acetyl-CoA-carboxylase] ligase
VFSRIERFGTVDSTQRIVRDWLDAGESEVCVAVADEQTAGRGRHGRSWIAPTGAGLLVSAGFRPADLPPRHAWRVAAVVALAMVDAAERVGGLRSGTIGLKWPNDVVAAAPDGDLRKLAGVLGESVIEGDRIVGAIVGIGVNVDWAPGSFPPELAGSMTSLRALAGRPVDRGSLLEAWLEELGARYRALVGGRFDRDGWSERQRTTGCVLEVELGDGRLEGLAVGVDADSGALLLVPSGSSGSPTAIGSGEVVRCRFARRRR